VQAYLYHVKAFKIKGLAVFCVAVLVGTDTPTHFNRPAYLRHWRRYAAWLCGQAYLCHVKAFKV